MPDFVSDYWTWFITLPTVGGIVWLVILIIGNTKGIPPTAPGEEAAATGHVWDENLQELNTPLPRWWLIMFYITLIFGALYLLLYPGLGKFVGLLGWTEIKEYQREVRATEAHYGPLYERFLQTDLAALAQEPDAKKTGERLFVNYCAQCHGSDARGARGFPNLRDDAWQWGGTPQAIKTTILAGRNAVMPPWQDALGAEAVDQLSVHVLSLAGREPGDSAAAQAGKQLFQTNCVACHGTDGTGNPVLGAPNLTDKDWLYGASPGAIKRSIAAGRNGQMPPHQEFLGEAKVHVLAAYVYGLRGQQ